MDIADYLSNPSTAYLAKEYQRLSEELRSLDEMHSDGMDDLVLEEKAKLNERMTALQEHMQSIIEKKEAAADTDESDANEVILEVRAGAGGDEASIFARDLALMYQRYSALHGYSFSPVSISENDMGGYKEAAFQIRGSGVYGLLRFETGVHRVQRIPATEKSGRIHTSTASVAILPIQKQQNTVLDPSDVVMEFSRSGGAGGQNVNKVESAVRMVHVPTGIEVRCTEERTQKRNRERALEILTAKVDLDTREREAQAEASLRRSQIGRGDRSEKIRTYNLLQDRVTDHRIRKNWSGVENILNGSLEPITHALGEAYEQEGEA